MRSGCRRASGCRSAWRGKFALDEISDARCSPARVRMKDLRGRTRRVLQCEFGVAPLRNGSRTGDRRPWRLPGPSKIEVYGRPTNRGDHHGELPGARSPGRRDRRAVRPPRRIVRGWRRVDRRAEIAEARRQDGARVLHVYQDEDGTVTVRGRLTAEQGALLVRALDAARTALRDGRKVSAEPIMWRDAAPRPTETAYARRGRSHRSQTLLVP